MGSCLLYVWDVSEGTLLASWIGVAGLGGLVRIVVAGLDLYSRCWEESDSKGVVAAGSPEGGFVAGSVYFGRNGLYPIICPPLPYVDFLHEEVNLDVAVASHGSGFGKARLGAVL